MRLIRGVLWVCLLAAAFPAAAPAASIGVTGANGGPGANAPSGPGSGAVGGTGGAGEDATATADGPDATNSASATGGNGGTGGAGGDVVPPPPPGSLIPIGGPGGPGGSGGSATARAVTAVSAGDTTASATAQGGSGGTGGPEGTPTLASVLGPPTGPRNGATGAGGSADAQASATSQNGTANAASDANTPGSAPATSTASALSEAGAVTSTATSGAGGESHATSTSESHGAGSTSNASALSETAAAQADATSTAAGESHAISLAQSNGAGTALSNAQATGTGSVSAEATALVALSAAAESHASAIGHGASDALAKATARGGRAASTSELPGAVTISANATSEQGDATAQVDATGGDGFPAVLVDPIHVSGPVIPGTGGGAMVLVDAVHGSAAGRLSLIQKATGGFAGGNAGGTGHSELHAENPGGGALFAEALGYGGDGQTVPFPRMLTTEGGNGFALVVGTDTQGALVESHAFAQGGFGSSSTTGLPIYGSAESHATAQGLGPLIARADTGLQSWSSVATSEVIGVGSLVAARTHLSAAAPCCGIAGAGLHAETRLHAPAGSDGAFVPNDYQTQANLFAAPNSTDRAVWIAGNPHAQEASAGKLALGLGSLNGHNLGTSTVSGAFELDLTSSSFAPGTPLEIAFLDPINSGTAFSLLHLAFSIDGTKVFDESFLDGASAAAALDDAVVDLGSLGSPNDTLRHLVLSFEFAGNGFATDFVVFAPEPGSGGACGVALALLALVRARRGHWRGGRDSNPQLPA